MSPMEWMKWAADNSAAIQAIMAIAMVGVTVALSAITAYYAVVTHKMATIMQQQMEASFQPSVEPAITFRAEGTSWDVSSIQDDTVHGGILVENKSSVPLKCHSIKMAVHFKRSTFRDVAKVQDCQNIVLYPNGQKEFGLTVNVPPKATDEDFIRKVQLRCTDLTGRSKHTFVISDDSKDITHYLGFREDTSLIRRFFALKCFLGEERST